MCLRACAKQNQLKSWKSFTICLLIFSFSFFDKVFTFYLERCKHNGVALNPSVYLRVVKTLTVIDITVFIIIEERNEGENKLHTPYCIQTYVYKYGHGQ